VRREPVGENRGRRARARRDVDRAAGAAPQTVADSTRDDEAGGFRANGVSPGAQPRFIARLDAAALLVARKAPRVARYGVAFAREVVATRSTADWQSAIAPRQSFRRAADASARR